MIQVTKRNGTQEKLNLDKIHKVLELATQDLSGTSVSDIEINAQLSFHEGITTKEIHDILIKSAANLISLDTSNYQYVAARLLLYSLRKEVWGESEPPRLLEHIQKCVDINVYENLLEKYSETEIHKLGRYLKHDRDDRFTYSGLQQMVDKYLVKNRKTNQIHETPQFAYMLIAMTLFQNSKDRIKYIKKAYDYFSKFKISIPTPIMAGARTPVKAYTSCVLIDVDDSMDSIFASVSAVGQLTARRAGIGLNLGRMRAIGAEIRNGEVIHTGVIPFLKVFESTVKSCHQNSLRGGGGTVHFPFWHYEIEDILVLKNNAGTDDNRVRKLDYSIQFSQLFYDRVKENKDITLFSPHEVPELYESFGRADFDEIYETCERKHLKQKKKIKARKLLELFTRERLETGRYYIMNIDHCNKWPWKSQVVSSNLCQEILHPLKSLTALDDQDAEIGMCILAGINICETKEEEYQDVCDVIVRMLDELIDLQEYPVKATENFARKKRSLGIGISNIAAYLAKNKTLYTDKASLTLIDDVCELVQYNLLLASNNLAREKGKCEDFEESCYADGEFPFEYRPDEIDDVIGFSTICDWDSLRESIKEYGLRHCTLTCCQPFESSSVIQNSTNGIEPPRALLSYKKSKMGALPQLVPYLKYKNYYQLAWDIPNRRLSEICGVIQKWFDMSISLNHYYDYTKYENQEIPMSELIKDQFYLYKMGGKTLYYTNSKLEDEDSPMENCIGGACAI